MSHFRRGQEAQPELAEATQTEVPQGLVIDEATQAVIDKATEVSAIKERITGISSEMREEGADQAALQDEFRGLIKRLNELNKASKTAKGTGTKRDVTGTKLGVLKDALVSFQPRNTAITLEGNVNAIGVDGRNGFYIITIVHATGMKFTKKVDTITLMEPTEEQTAKLSALVQEQAAAISEAKLAKKKSATATTTDEDEAPTDGN